MQNLSQENWKYYRGETFEYWTGASPQINHPKYAEVMLRLKKSYHRFNIVSKIADHYTNALIGKHFNWYIAGSEIGQDGENAAEKYLQKWWSWQQKTAISQKLSFGDPIATAITQMLVCDDGTGTGTGYLRLYSPQKYQNLASYQKCVLHCPDLGSITTWRDDDGILYKAEYCYNKGKETYLLLDSGLTQIDIDKQESKIIDLGGRLPIFELHGKTLITNAIKDCQNAINKGLTLKGENLNFAGFLERVILNGQMPGTWIKQENGGDKFVPDGSAIQGGPGQVMYVQGVPIGDKSAPSGYTNPNIIYRDPVAVSNFVEDFDLNLKCAYMAADLGHLLSAADGTLSGVSRKTIKEDFETGLNRYSQNIESVLATIFDTILYLSGFQNQETVVKLDLNTGAPLPEERQQNREDYKAGLLSWTTAVMATGLVVDADAEWELKQRELDEIAEKTAKESNNFVEDFSNDPSVDDLDVDNVDLID